MEHRGVVDPIDLAKRVPPVGDRALLDLVNGIHVSHDIVEYRRRRGWLRGLYEALLPRGQSVQTLLEGNLLGGQETLTNLVMEVQRDMTVSGLALVRTQDSLRETRAAVRSLVKSNCEHRREVKELEACLESIQEGVASGLAAIEERLARVELRVNASDELDEKLEAWASGRTYRSLPWCAQLALLSWELFAGAVGDADAKFGREAKYRSRVVDKIERHLKERGAVPDEFSVATTLDRAWHSTTDPDRMLLSEMLDPCVLGGRDLVEVPFHFVLEMSLQLASLEDELRPSSPTGCVLEVCRARGFRMPRVLKRAEFVRNICSEVADAHFRIRMQMRDRTRAES